MVQTHGFSAATADLVHVALYVVLAMACSVAVVDIVQGRRIAVRETYVATMRCWRAILVALAAGGGVAAFELVLWLTAMWLVTQIQTLCGTTASAGGKLLYNVIALSLVSLFVVVAVFAVKFLFASIALLTRQPMQGMRRGLELMCDDAFFLRSLKATVVVAAISTIGWQLVVSVGHELGVVAHSILVAIVVQTIGRLVLDILLVSFVVIYAIDLMVRSPHGDRDLDAERGPLDSVTC